MEEKNTLSDHSLMNSLLDDSFGEFHQFSDEEDVGGSSITNDVVLCGGCSGDHSRSRVLHLHLMQQDVTVLGQFDLTCTSHQPLNLIKT